jgi:ADP-glucose pyrophosphorylase
VEHSRAEYILVLPSDLIYRMDYGDLLRHHAAGGKDFTVVTGHRSEHPIGVFVFRRDALVQAVAQHAGAGRIDDFDRIVARLRGKGSDIYRFDDYVRNIDTVDEYYAASMDLLPERRAFDPYGDSAWPIRTLSGAPLLESSRYASNSRVALAARIKGANVADSIVSFAARVHPDAQVEDSVILNGAEIGRGARIRRAIVTESTIVPPFAEIGFNDAADQEKYRVTPKGIVIVDSQGGAKQRYEQRRAARVATRQPVR